MSGNEQQPRVWGGRSWSTGSSRGGLNLRQQAPAQQEQPQQPQVQQESGGGGVGRNNDRQGNWRGNRQHQQGGGYDDGQEQQGYEHQGGGGGGYGNRGGRGGRRGGGGYHDNNYQGGGGGHRQNYGRTNNNHGYEDNTYDEGQQDQEGDRFSRPFFDRQGGRGGGNRRGNNDQSFWGGRGGGSGGGRREGSHNSFRDSADPSTSTTSQPPLQSGFDGTVPENADEAEVLKLFEKTRMNTGINFQKYAKLPVRCVPEGVTPMESFEHMQMDPKLSENIKRAGYTVPTPIQRYAVPIVSKGKDLMGCAQTGSGKTAAFLIPVISNILDEGKGRLPQHLRATAGNAAVPVALIMAPTRELVQQIHEEARKFCFRTGTRPVIVYGGVDSYAQKRELQIGADIIVATPGRLWDLYNQNTMFFTCIRFVVLDEADKMLDMGFGEQIDAILTQSDMPRTGERQTLMFSATFPAMIQTLAKNYLKEYFFVTIGRVGGTTEGITQRVELVDPSQKMGIVHSLLRKDPTALTLIFVDTKQAAEDLLVALTDDGYSVSTIHGNRAQHEREEALARFRRKEITVLVATDVASRGLDIPDVAHVIQYDMPKALDDYIHRIGRTGRAGNVGLATGLFTEDDAGIATELLEIMKEHNQSVPEWLPEMTQKAIQHKVSRQTRGGGRRRGGGGY